jgi:hypothetical protein
MRVLGVGTRRGTAHAQVQALIDAALSLAADPALDGSGGVLFHHDFHHSNVLWQTGRDRRVDVCLVRVIPALEVDVTRAPNNGGRQLYMRKLLAISLASVGPMLLATTLLMADSGDHDGAARQHEPASAAPPTTASTGIPTPTTARPGSTTPATSVAQPVSSNPPAAPTAPEPEPEPVMADGRHPVFLTDVDVDGATVEFDLLQYLTDAEQEAYKAAHPTEHAGCGCDDGGPIHNDNPRLRRLPVAPDMRVFVQGSTSGTCDGAHTTTFSVLPGYLFNGDHDYEPGTGHLGFSAFWLTMDHDTVVDIEELSCAG